MQRATTSSFVLVDRQLSLAIGHSVQKWIAPRFVARGGGGTSAIERDERSTVGAGGWVARIGNPIRDEVREVFPR